MREKEGLPGVLDRASHGSLPDKGKRRKPSGGSERAMVGERALGDFLRFRP